MAFQYRFSRRPPGRTGRSGALLLLPSLFLVLLVGVAPFGEALRGSLVHDIYGEVSFAGLENFRMVLSDRGFSYSLNITVLWAVTNVTCSLLAGFLLALVLQDTRRRILFIALLVPMAIPVYIAIPLWRAFLHGNGGVSVLSRLSGITMNLMVNPAAGFVGSLIVSLWLSIPLTTFVFAGHMRKVGRHILDAARLEGAGPLAVARFIYLPEICESLIAMAVLNFIKAFKEFTLVFLMTAGGPPLIRGITERYIIGATTTLGVFLYEVFLQTPDWGINAAYSVVITSLLALSIAAWILVRRPNPRRGLLILTALSVMAGGTAPYLLIGFFYLLPVFRRRCDHPRALIPLIPHLVLTVAHVVSRGFLAGFQPGIVIAVLLLVVPGNRFGRIPDRFRHRKSSRRVSPGLINLFSRRSISVPSAGSGLSLVFILVTGAILYMLVWMSLSRISACYVDSLLPPVPTFENYRLLFTEEGMGRVFLNTFVVAAATALLVVPVVFSAAVYLDSRGRRIAMVFVAGVQILGIAGGMHTLIPLYSVFRRLGLLDSWIPLILVYTYHAIPFSLFILTAYLEGIPHSFRDLAEMEGMGSGAYGLRILLPLALPQIFTIAMLAFVSGWNGFQAPLLFLNSEELYTVSMKLYGYVGAIGSGAPLWNLFAAAAVVNSLLVGGLFLRFRSPLQESPISDFHE